jgi:hypothetical protein
MSSSLIRTNNHNKKTSKQIRSLIAALFLSEVGWGDRATEAGPHQIIPGSSLGIKGFRLILPSLRHTRY